MTRKALAAISLAVLIAVMAVPAWAQEEEAEEGPALTAVDDLTQGDISNGSESVDWLSFLRTLGLVVFTTPFNTFDGLGDGPFDGGDPRIFGHRPTLQGNGVFLRLNGLDAQSCNECHSLVSHATVPPELGIGGAGTVAQSAFPVVSMVDVADTFDNRVRYYPGHDPDLVMKFDGEADYNGRFINAPFLFGGGGVELLAKEMTADLQDIYKKAKDDPLWGAIYGLKTHGTDYGYALSTGPGSATLHLDGLGLTDPGLTPEEQLVVRPFGRKGDAFSMRDFDRGAMQFHFGMQPVEVVGNLDPDEDGVYNEVTVVEMSVLHIFDVTNPPPYMEPLDLVGQIGYENFKAIGCADCHRPEMRTNRQLLPLAFPEVDTNPWQNVYLNINLTQFGFAPVPHGGVVVPLFSDLKRHDMGDGPQGTPRLKEDCEGPPQQPLRCKVPNEDFITARLWGISDTGPYLHDGRATTLRQAIEAHAGEAATAAQNFANLSPINQIRLINFLRKLRTPPHPNEDILP